MRLWTSILLILILSACSQETQQSNESPEPEEEHPLELTPVQMENINLTLDSVQMRPLRDLLKINGYLQVPPHSEALITSLVEAQVTTIRARPFHWASKNETLLELSGQSILDLQQSYFEHQSELKFTEKEYNRRKELLEGGHIAERDFEMSEREYNQLKASLAGFSSKLRLLGLDPDNLDPSTLQSRIYIKAPIKGSIEQIHTRINEYVHPGDPLIRLVNLEDMHIELEVFERDLASIELGMQVEFWLLDAVDEHYSATIEHISKEVDPNRRTITAHAHLKEVIEGLRPGNYVEARVILSSDQIQSLPNESFVNDQGLTYIFRVEGGDDQHTHFEKIPVITTISDGGYTSFRTIDGNSINGQFVVNGAYFLMAQSRIDQGLGGDHH